MRDGLGERISLEFILPHAGAEREAIMSEVDTIALYHYKLKVAYEDRVRKRFGRMQGMNDADAEDEAAAELVNAVVKDLSFGELVQGDADDLAAEETDSEDESSDEDEWSSDEDDSEGSESESSEGSEGGGTEREGTPNPRGQARPPPPVSPRSPDQRRPASSIDSPTSPQSASSSSSSSSVKRANTLGHVPLPLPSKLGLKSKGGSRESSSRSSTDRPAVELRYSRSLNMKQPRKRSPPPPLPKSAPAVARSRSRTRPQSLPPSKKKGTAIEPPVLHHLPQLLPIFMELVSGLPCVRRANWPDHIHR